MTCNDCQSVITVIIITFIRNQVYNGDWCLNEWKNEWILFLENSKIIQNESENKPLRISNFRRSSGHSLVTAKDESTYHPPRPGNRIFKTGIWTVASWMPADLKFHLSVAIFHSALRSSAILFTSCSLRVYRITRLKIIIIRLSQI